jgi:hypothetical protein
MGSPPPQASYGGHAAAPQFDLAGNPLPAAAPYVPPSAGHGAPPPYGQPGAPMGAPPGGGYGAPQGAYAGPPRTGGRPAPVAASSGSGEKKGFPFVAVAIAAVIVLVGYFLFQNFMPATVPAPTLGAMYTDPLNTFSMKTPEGWAMASAEDVKGDESASDQNGVVGGVKFSQGTAFIDVTTEDLAQAKKIQLLTASGPGSEAFTDALSTLKDYDHRMKARTEARYRNYEETGDGKLFIIPGFGAGYGYTFTASGSRFGLPATLKGYRVVMMGPSRTAYVLCECRASNYDTLKKSFQDMINSMQEKGSAAPSGPGGPGGIPSLSNLPH